MAGMGRAGRSALLLVAAGLLPGAIGAGPGDAQAQDTIQGAAQGAVRSVAQAEAPGPARPGIRVSPVILAEPEVETQLIIQVGPEAAIPRQTFVRIRNLPLAAKLSEGHVVTPGIWAVPLSALPTLRLIAPLSTSGRTEIHLALVGVDGTVLSETKSSLVVAPAWLLGNGTKQEVQRVPSPRPDGPGPASAPAAPTAPAVVAALPPVAPPSAMSPLQPLPPPPAPVLPAARPAPPAPPAAAPVAPSGVKTAPAISAADRERAEAMIQRGDGFMRQGNLAAARQFFRRAADMGHAVGALRMGGTYDPAELATQKFVGVDADPKEAARWYERARDLGATEAGARLSRLPTR
jgi:hypothetical protein